ncbi:MAG: energy transducer TonB [Thermodesulfovibrio sp.]|nr:energy transducer TonB [Thermodesulfovibrio sp.]
MFHLNRIQHFLIISIFFHLLVFFSWIFFSSLAKNPTQYEVFIISDFKQNFKQNILQNSHKNISIRKEKGSTNQENIQQTTHNETVETLTQNSLLEDSDVFTTWKDPSGFSSNKKDMSSLKGMIETEFGNINGPKFIYRETPIYPAIARRLGKEGKVILRLTIDEKGNLIEIEVVESAPYGFTEAAIEAVKKSKFAPAMYNGRPVACKAILPIRFILTN